MYKNKLYTPVTVRHVTSYIMCANKLYRHNHDAGRGRPRATDHGEQVPNYGLHFIITNNS